MIYKYAHPEWFEGIEEPDLQSFNGKLIIHGTGGLGALAEYALRKLGIDCVCFTDNVFEKQDTTFIERKVYSPARAYSLYPDAIVLVAGTSIEAIKDSLKLAGYEKIFDCFTLFKEIDLNGFDYTWTNQQICRNIDTHLKHLLLVYNKWPKNKVIPHIGIGLTTKCNLRCKNCSEYIPHIKNPKDFCCNETIRVLKKIAENFDINEISICLAEAFLYKQLHVFLEGLSELKNIETIYVVTNGTILPHQELIEILRNDRRVCVRISNYTNGNTSCKLEKLVDIFEIENIKYEITNHSFWIEQKEMYFQNLTKEELQRKFRNCFNRKLVLLDGKIFLCFYDYLLNELGLCNETYGIDVKELNDIDFVNEVSALVNTKIAIPACQYCHKVFREKIKRVPIAEQL